MYIFVYIFYTYIDIYIYIYIIYLFIFAYTYIYIYIYICTYLFIHLSSYIILYIYIYIYVYTFILLQATCNHIHFCFLQFLCRVAVLNVPQHHCCGVGWPIALFHTTRHRRTSLRAHGDASCNRILLGKGRLAVPRDASAARRRQISLVYINA